MEKIVNLPMAVLAAVDAAILQDADEVNDIFDCLLDDIAAEKAAVKSAKSGHDWDCTCSQCYVETFKPGGMLGGAL